MSGLAPSARKRTHCTPTSPSQMRSIWGFLRAQPLDRRRHPLALGRLVLPDDAEEDALAVAVEVPELVFGEAREVVAEAEPQVVFDDVVELEERAVLPVPGERLVQEAVLGADVPLVEEVVVDPVDPEDTRSLLTSGSPSMSRRMFRNATFSTIWKL